MSVNKPEKEYLDMMSKSPSGKKMLYDKQFSDEIKEKYKGNINEQQKQPDK